MRTPPHLLPALVTPFARSGDVDLAAHADNLGLLWDLGIRGFLLGGSTGEGPYLEPGERRSLTESARATLGGRAFLMVGVAAETVRQAERLAREAADGGADALLVLTPTTLARRVPAAPLEFFRRVADAAPLPVLLYSVPSVTAFALPEETVLELAGHPNVVGMKDSGGDPVRLQRLLAGLPETFFLFNGSSQALTLSLAAGAYGAITASANYAPRLLLDLVDRARRSPLRARPAQARLSELSAAVESRGVPGIKAAAAGIGLRPGRPRLPLRPLPGAAAGRLADLAKAAQAF